MAMTALETSPRHRRTVVAGRGRAVVAGLVTAWLVGEATRSAEMPACLALCVPKKGERVHERFNSFVWTWHIYCGGLGRYGWLERWDQGGNNDLPSLLQLATPVNGRKVRRRRAARQASMPNPKATRLPSTRPPPSGPQPGLSNSAQDHRGRADPVCAPAQVLLVSFPRLELAP